MSTPYLIATLVVPMVFAIVLHEIAHGWAARMLGDPTAYERGRLSLNPLKHVDPMGTLILPGTLKLLGLPVFGWAKPVPVSYARLRNPKRDMAFVAAAGPLTNFVLAALSAVAFGLLLRGVDPQGTPGWGTLFVADNLKNFIAINVFLGTFNLLPLPPFDGSRIVRGLSPAAGVRLLDRDRTGGHSAVHDRVHRAALGLSGAAYRRPAGRPADGMDALAVRAHHRAGGGT